MMTKTEILRVKSIFTEKYLEKRRIQRKFRYKFEDNWRFNQ